MLRTSRQEHQLLRDHQRRLQAIELGQAGVERAAAQLAADDAYRPKSGGSPRRSWGAAKTPP